MAKNDNLTDYLTDLADGIRAKKGTTDPINPQDFRKEIESIEGGGSAEDGESSWRYFDCKQVPAEIRVETLGEIQSMIIKAQSLAYNSIMSTANISYVEDPSAIVAFGVDMSIETNITGEFISLGKLYETTADLLAQAGIVEITKEQFYSLE